MDLDFSSYRATMRRGWGLDTLGQARVPPTCAYTEPTCLVHISTWFLEASGFVARGFHVTKALAHLT